MPSKTNATLREAKRITAPKLDSAGIKMAASTAAPAIPPEVFFHDPLHY
jgi:hypothetical protein